MLVYLDTSILRTADRDHDTADAISDLRKRQDIEFVFSAAHFDDLVAASSETDMRFRREVLAWPRKVWCVPGSELPTVEIEELLAARHEDRLPQRVVPFRQYLETFPETLQWEEIRTERVEGKAARARAETHAKRARASHNVHRESLPDMVAFLRGEFVADRKAYEEAWEIWQTGAATIEEETDLSIEELLLSISNIMQEGPWRDVAQLVEGNAMPLKLFIAARDNARIKAADIMSTLPSFAPQLMAQVNPLDLNLGAEASHHFQQLLGWLPKEEATRLMADPSGLRDVFKAWLGEETICPAGLVVREVAWQMARDTGAKSVPSDQTDRCHVALLPYVDVLFADKRVVGYIQQSSGIPAEWGKRCLKCRDFVGWVHELE